MSLDALDRSLDLELEAIKAEGRFKPAERVIVGYIPPKEEKGPRYKLLGSDKEFIRMNSNSYLSLSHHPELVKAADEATRQLGVGPGAVRFIDGTFSYHVALEERIARFMEKPAARIFNSAYTANCGLALAISSPKTYWVGDLLNHNSIIRAMRIANVPSENKAIYAHNDMNGLQNCLEAVPSGMERVAVIFDGIFSMRGDFAPIDQIQAIVKPFCEKFKDGVFTIVDDSHGIGAFGPAGRGTAGYTKTSPDIIIGTFGKALGANGGFIAASPTVIETVRQKADTYIYTNPLSVADCAAAAKALDICDSIEGRECLEHLRQMTARFRRGLGSLGWQTIPGPHPIVPLLVRDTPKTHELVRHFFNHSILSVGLTFPVVPRGDETIRFQINAAHTPADIDLVLNALEDFK